MMTWFKPMLTAFLLALVLTACAGYAPVKYTNGIMTNTAGKPLYLWNKDQKPGDMTGEGFNNAWRRLFTAN